MPDVSLDLKVALRGLWKSKGFALLAALTLGLGIGANTAVFSVLHDVLLEPLPLDEPDRLVTLWEIAPDDAGRLRRFRATAGSYRDWKSESESFEDMALFGAAGLNWTGDGEPEQLLGARVSPSYFSVLGIQPVLGRTFLPEEARPGSDRVVILSHGLWKRRFGGADVVGRTLTLDGAPYLVIGVMPEAVYPTWPQATGRIPFLSLYQQMWVPMALTEERLSDRRTHVFGVIARLRDDVRLATARAEMDTIAQRLDPSGGERVLVVPYMEEVVGSARAALWTLLVAVVLLLATACANIAGLVLARATLREREAAMRSALGAGRAALVRPFLAESLLLGIGGGFLGVLFASAGITALVRLSPQEVPRLAETALSGPAVLLAFALALVASIGLGVAPMMHLRRVALSAGVRSREVRGGLSGSRRSLVVAEVAVALVLVGSAALLLSSFRRLSDVNLGFSNENVLVAELTLPPSEYPTYEEISLFHAALLERLEAMPGVRSAALAYDHPLESNWIDSFRIVGAPETDEGLGAALRIVTPDYFRTLGIEVKRGRPFSDLDDPEHPGVVLVNEAFAARYFGGADPLGERLLTSTPRNFHEDLPDIHEVVGVVSDVRFLGPATPPEPAFYLPAAQFPQWETLVVARTEGDPETLVPRLREEVWAVDPDLPVSSVTTMTRLLNEELAQPRFVATVLGGFAVAALLLAALGIYGLLASGVAQRTAEIGVRMALGARAGHVVAMVVSEGLRLTALGLAFGLVAALASTRILGSQLFEVSPTDPASLAAGTLFLAVVAAVASYLPARKASRVDPLVALRSE